MDNDWYETRGIDDVMIILTGRWEGDENTQKKKL